MSDRRTHETARGCPDVETLAAYVDGRLTADAHAVVQAHLAECEVCFELVAETARAVSAEVSSQTPQHEAKPPTDSRLLATPPGARVVPFRRRAALAISSVASLAAAVLLVVALQPEWWQRLRGTDAGAHIAALMDASRTERTIDARLTGFAYAPLRSPTRSGAIRDVDNLPLLAAAAVAEEAAQKKPTPGHLHAWGVAQLLIHDHDGAIHTLERAAVGRPDDAGVLNDLAAAYLARGQRAGRADDLSKALAAADRVLQLDPTRVEALFNRAAALEALGQNERAVEAWKEVGSRDRSDWRAEADRRLRDLTGSEVR